MNEEELENKVEVEETKINEDNDNDVSTEIPNENKEVESKNEEETKEKKMMAQKGDFYDAIEIDNITDCVTRINEKRATFSEFMSSAEKMNKLLAIIALLLCVVAIIITLIYPTMVFTTFIVVLMYLFLAFFVKRQNTKKINIALEGYLTHYGKMVDSYIYGRNFLISDLSLSYRTKLEKEEVCKINIYKDVVKTATRDYVVGRMAGVDFYATDVAFKEKVNEKEIRTISVGKMFKFNLRSKEEGRLIVYLSPLRENKPTNIEGLKEVNVNGLKEGFEVYTSFQDYSKYFSSNFIQALNEFTPNDFLEGICVVIDDKHVYAFLEYADAIMVPPYKEDMTEEKLSQYGNDVNTLVNLLPSIINLSNVEKVNNK